MNENTVVITEKNGTYQIQNNGLSEFALLGILERIVFDLKSVSRNSPSEPTEPPPPDANREIAAEQKQIEPENKKETGAAPDLRTRVGNAVKAVRALGGRIEDLDIDKLSDERLQTELEELTDQYKRLKNSSKSK